ncbi:hypothetical protein FKB34_02705 [Glycocaulis profundi]|nr:hypothetical protein FKB34_02705 [Glycocaulis profundi]
MKIMQSFLISIVCVFATGCATSDAPRYQSSALAKSDAEPMPLGYDDAGEEPDIEDILQDIARELRVTLRDPYSVRDLRVCNAMFREARGAQYIGWQPSVWAFNFTLNARTAAGGYAGLSHFLGSYRHGELVRITNLTSEAREIGLAVPYDASVFDGCRRVSQQEWEALLEGVG